MPNIQRACALPLLLILLAGCAGIGPRAPHPAPPVSISPASDAHAAYLLAQYYLRVNQPERALEAYERALELDPQAAPLMVDLAALYVRQGKVRQALELAERAVQADPDHEEAYVLLGRLYAGTGQNHKAIDAYRRVLELNPSNEDAYLLLGTLYAQEGRFTEALQVLDRLRTILPDNPLAAYYKARIFLDMKFYDQAETAYLEVLQLNPTFERALLDLAYIYETTDRFLDAERAYQQILSFHPMSAVARTRLGNLYMRQKLYQKALEQFETLSRQNAGDIESRLKIGIIHLQQGRYQEAIADFTALLKDKPEYDQALYYLATTYEEKGERADLEQAVVNLRLIPKTSPLWNNAQMRLGVIFSKLNDHASGIQCLEAAIAENPEVADFYLYLAFLHEDIQEYAKALEVLDRGLAVSARNVQLLFRKGVVLDKLDRKDEAIQVMRSLLDVEPDHAGALNYIGYTYADKGIRLQEAKNLIERALEKEPEDGYILDSLAWVYYRLGQYREALKTIQKALAHVPDDPIILEHLGDIQAALGNRKEAWKAYERALESGHEKPETVRAKLKGL